MKRLIRASIGFAVFVVGSACFALADCVNRRHKPKPREWRGPPAPSGGHSVRR
jgi:hypothetical protein